MGWEQRGSYSYYIRRYRVSGRKVRRSLGRGLAAIQAAAIDAERRAHKEQARVFRRELEALDNDVLTFIKLIDRLLQAHLLLAGYHQHHRSEWRKRYGPIRAHHAGAAPAD
jgi:hypothetical protein